MIWVKTGEAGAKGYDQEGSFLQRSEERERGLMAGAEACCPLEEEVLGCMGSTLGLEAKGGAGMVSVWTEESGGTERHGGWAETRAREVSEV